MKIIELKLRGPMALLEEDAERAFLFAQEDAWRSGIYLWSFLYNQADRINAVGVANDGIAPAHAVQVASFLRGEHVLHAAGDRAEGRLRRVYEPGEGPAALTANAVDLRAELNGLRIFFAPVDEGAAVQARIAAALTRHYQRLGGKAMEWFQPGRAGEAPAGESGEAMMVRFYRPVLMVNMPDELMI